jgi:hypothetical protein
VVEHLERLTAGQPRKRAGAPTAELVSGVSRRGWVELTADFRDYFRVLGGGIGRVIDERSPPAPLGHLAKRVELDARLRSGHLARRPQYHCRAL